MNLLCTKSRIDLLKNLFYQYRCLHRQSLVWQQNLETNPATKPIIYEPVIGLEVHAQIQSVTKLFSCAPTDYLARPNTQVAYFDLSLPGTLPVLNRTCVEVAIRTGLALDCEIPLKSSFDRKHYFYGDTPNGYQITQQREPIAKNGYIDFIVYDDYLETQNRKLPPEKRTPPYIKRCRLKQIQLEQDSGKSLHHPESNENLIDLNRTGVALMEFVFEPDLHSTFEASSLVRELVIRLKAVGACSCKMDEGALRVDANISLLPTGSEQLGTRTEIKNLNSFRFIRGAIDCEIERQTELLQSGMRVINETMGYDLRRKKTFLMRDKEIVQDYRFMPEPNLPPILLRDSDCDTQPQDKNLIDIAESRSQLPISDLPQSIRAELSKPEYQLSNRAIFFLLQDIEMRQLLLDIYHHSQRKNGEEIFEFLFKLGTTTFEDKRDRLVLATEKVRALTSVANLAELIDLQNNNRITEPTVYDILQLYTQKDQRSPGQIVQQFNWWLVTDPAEIEAVCLQIIQNYPKVAKTFAKKGVRKPNSTLITQAQVALGNRVNESELWKLFERLLRPDKKTKQNHNITKSDDEEGNKLYTDNKSTR